MELFDDLLDSDLLIFLLRFCAHYAMFFVVMPSPKIKKPRDYAAFDNTRQHQVIIGNRVYINLTTFLYFYQHHKYLGLM